MNWNDLNSTWRSVETPVKTAVEIQSMLSENRHPVLKGIRKQLAIEIAGWSLLLICYYTMLDGDRKPLWTNLLLIFTVTMPLVHNLTGYRFFRYVINGTSIRASLQKYLSKLKVYATVSIISRALLMTGLLIFLTQGIHLTGKKYFIVAFIVLCFIIQLLLIYRVWLQRHHALKKQIMGLDS